MRKILVAGASSGVGKTTVTLGLMQVFKSQGFVVQGFKCGPDFIDSHEHTAFTQRPSRNLDSWMCSETTVREIFQRGCQGADIAIIEGVMGLFDGEGPRSDRGSSAEIARLVQAPVLLVIDGSKVARSAAAIVKGFQTMLTDIHICAVVTNFVGGKGHFQLLQQAIEQECDVPVVGYMTEDKLNRQSIRDQFDLQRLYEAMSQERLSFQSRLYFGMNEHFERTRIAVARDEAFSFYYEENLELLEHVGAKLRYFSPLHGEPLPSDVSGLYLGGGFPEHYLQQLSQQTNVLQSIHDHINKGLPTFAEGGGMLYLCKEIENFPMVGVIPGCVRMSEHISGFGYREVSGSLLASDETARGQLFHYTTVDFFTSVTPAFVSNMNGATYKYGIHQNNMIASYLHIHFGSAPQIAERFIKQCENYQQQI